MGVSPTPDSAEEILARMRALYAQLDDAQHHTAEYERISAEIRDLSIAYEKLVAANQDINRPDPKP